MKFTDASIKALKPKKSRYEVWETNGRGFGLRIGTSGKKSWIFLYRIDGLPKRMTFGEYPRMSLSEAHEVHAKARNQLDKGIDPGEILLEKKEANKTAPTINTLVDEYLEKYAKVKKRSWEEDQRILQKDVVPVWGKRKAKDIKRRDIILLLDQICERGAPIAANRTLGIIRRMFGFAVARDILEASPCIQIEPPGKERSRDRVLNEKEIKTFWFGLDKAKMDPKTKLALKLLLTTLQRKGEVINAEWSEFDLKNNWWTIPAEKSKNNLPHRVYLNSLSLKLLNEIKKISNDSKWLFPSPRGDKPITTRAVSHALLNNQMKPKSTKDKKRQDSFGLEKFTPHDLRRSGASLLASLGIARLTIGKILNHTEAGVTSVYDRHSYDEEKRKALETWSYKLDSILAGKKGKVIPIKA